MKKTKIIILLSLMLFCFSSACVFAASTVEFTISDTSVYTKTDLVKKSTIPTSPYIKDNRTMIPVRALCEAFNSTVNWDDATRTVTIVSGDINISMVIGENKMLVNGEEKQMDCASEIINSTTFIPLRAVSENLGYYVYYVDSTKQIIVDDIPPAFEISGVGIGYNQILTMYDINKYDSSEITDQSELEYANGVTLNNTYQYLDQIYTLYVIAQNNNISLTDDEKAELAENVNKIRNDETQKDKILSASMIKILQDYKIAQKYWDTLCSGDYVSQEDAEKIYKENYVCAKHVLIMTGDTRTDEEAKAIADLVYSRASAGEDFDLLVNEYGEDPGMTVNVGGYIFTKNEMVAEFEQASFSLQDNQISAPIKTTFGYHVIKRLPLPNDTDKINTIRENLIYSYANQTVATQNDSLEFSVNIPPEDFLHLISPVPDKK